MDQPIEIPEDIPSTIEEVNSELNKPSRFPWKNNPEYEDLTDSDAESDDELPSVTYDLNHKSEQSKVFADF